MPPLSLFCIGCLVGAAETAAPPLVCIDGLVGAAETAAPPAQQEGSVCSVNCVGDSLSGCVGMAGMPYPPMLAEHLDSL